MNTNSSHLRWLAGFVAIVMFLALQPGAFAQVFTAVTGSVSDPTGAVIPGVEVTMTNEATGASRLVITNETGSYKVTQLPPGTYTISASLPGFSTQQSSGVVLPIGETVVVNLALEVGVITDVVDVIATTEAVNTVDAKLGVGFDTQKIIDLPLNARNIVGLLGLQAGVQVSDLRIDEDTGEETDDGGQVNGARNDQQNIVLDGVNINRQEKGSSLEGALPTTIDSIQEFLVQTAGSGGTGARGSGGQVQLVTKSGSNEWHGSAYEFYRTTGTSARSYFAVEPQQLIRHLPSGSLGGPILQDKLFIFGAYERQTDRSTTLATRDIPTPEFLDGIVRYERNDGSFATLSDGPSGQLENWTHIPGDTWNPVLVGQNGYYQIYRPFSQDAARTKPGEDNGANTLRYRFNSPFVRNRNIYITRMDFTASENHTMFFRGTLNDDVRTLGAESFPGFGDARERLDNSKGFAASWNWVISPSLNNNFTAGLTRESFEETGNNRSYYNAPLFDEPFQTEGATRTAIDTWNLVENLSYITGNHNIQAGLNFRSLENNLNDFNEVEPAQYGGGANLTANNIGVASSPGFKRAVGEAEFENAVSPHAVGDAVMAATGSLSRFTEDVQYDPQGNRLAPGSPLARNYRLQEYDWYIMDTWRATRNLTLTFGINHSYQTPPYESNGVQVNWVQDLGQRIETQSDTTKTALELPLYTASPAGRGNGRPDYYNGDINNWAPRMSFAWTPQGDWATAGGPLVVRGGYSRSYDAIGRRFARDAALTGSIGLKSEFSVPGFFYSIDDLDDAPGGRAPRIGPGFSLPRAFFPTPPDTADFVAPATAKGIGGITYSGIDRGIFSPSSNLLNLTISKELPGGWVIETSYVGRFARDLLGQVDIASPVNVRDPISGQTYYQAIKTLYETYEFNYTPVDQVQPIPWFENVYQKALTSANKRLDGAPYPSATQAFYALLHKSRGPGPNTAASLVDEIQGIEGREGNVLLNPQAQFFGVFSNISRSNYNSGQFTMRKRFSDGFTWAANYTFAKSMDITSAAESEGNRANGSTNFGLAEDPYNPELNYHISDFNRTHQFNSNFLVELPFGQGKPFASNVSNVANHIIGGWQFSGIMVTSSGRPWQFTASSRYNHHYFGRTIPHMVRPVEQGIFKQNGQVFLVGPDKQARIDYTNRDPGQEYFWGAYPGSSIQRNQGLGPAFFNMDFAITKNFTVTEDVRARFRWEAFNVMNHPNFDIPTDRNGRSVDRTSGLLGQVTNTRGTERVMQFSFRLEF